MEPIFANLINQFPLEQQEVLHFFFVNCNISYKHWNQMYARRDNYLKSDKHFATIYKMLWIITRGYSSWEASSLLCWP